MQGTFLYFITSCALVICLIVIPTWGYYDHVKCYGTGDCVIAAGNLGGGQNNDREKWMIECGDGEGMIGIYDFNYQFRGLSQVWCYFMFPLKPPSQGIYPYYPYCNVRNLTLREFYCYDQYYPGDTYNTFVTGLFALESYDPVYPSLMKCCKTPPQYALDYSRCQWKYTHDKYGEHYDGQWIVKCDTNFVMTGLGQAMNPWDNYFHWVWIQCCPYITVGNHG
ncbi:uncharacterized protein LOC129585331 [Paramacrobiotus metropolitanus]|uniref:uncharacterized protein LOC129585331 n=1 Tax=Paramacrobiotus metropolitanus TaxID=2943436 RepID=UPI002446587F|nr:uncharacterized protein LOC129585331 [Paramacrobiotus metropolitanus]